MEQNIRIVVDVQKNHMEQNERQYDNIIKVIDDKASLLESVIKQSSVEINELHEENKSIHEIIGRHESAIKTLKRKLI